MGLKFVLYEADLLTYRAQEARSYPDLAVSQSFQGTVDHDGGSWDETMPGKNYKHNAVLLNQSE